MSTPKSKKARVKPPRGRPASTSALSHPVVENSSSVFSLSSFSPKGDLFAYISLSIDKHRLRVYDTVSGQSVTEHVVDAGRVTALSWSQFDPSEGNKTSAPDEDLSSKKKRKKRNSTGGAAVVVEQANAPQVVVLGLSNGSVLIFSPSHGRILRTLSHPSSTASILSLDISTTDNATTLYTSSSDGLLHLWDARTSNHLASWKDSARIPFTSIRVRKDVDGEDDDHASLLLAHHSIRLYSTPLPSSISDTLDPQEKASFTGHASNITDLRWEESKSEGEPPRRFVSAAEADRIVYLWEVPDSASKEGKLLASMPLDSDARQVAFSSSRKQDLLVLSASGKVSVFTPSPDVSASSPAKKGKHKVHTLTPRSTVRVTTKGRATVKLASASFVHDQEGRVRVAWMVGGLRPMFEVIQYLDDAGNFIPDATSFREDATSALATEDQGTVGAPTKRYAEAPNLAVRSGTDPGQDASADDIAMRDADGALDVDLAELSLGQRLTALDPASAPAHASDSESPSSAEDDARRTRKKAAAAAPSSITLTRTLIQALHSSDTRLLETCLSSTEPGLVMNTVRRLPPQLAVPLLNACVERLGRGKRAGTMKGGGGAAGSQRAGGLVRWIKTVLVVHSGHLMTMPDLVARLAGLHATLTTRLTLQDSLLSLSGRLDMVLQQIELRSSAAPAPLAQPSRKGGAKQAGKGKAVNGREPRVYVEGESEDEDAMEVEVEEGSEAGSIEDVELGGDEELDEDDEEEEEDDEEEDEEESEEGSDDDDSEGGPRLNGFIDDEAEESEEGSDDDESE
ncbi:NUC189-domain-containing protein [Dentipellis sp. KUC8613]|nr:NUC189-domain-containing protein [Dentipellis sp. KUC8613]